LTVLISAFFIDVAKAVATPYVGRDFNTTQRSSDLRDSWAPRTLTFTGLTSGAYVSRRYAVSAQVWLVNTAEMIVHAEETYNPVTAT